VTQVTDRVALPIRVHDLLLGLAGRLDDDALVEARELLASAEVDRSLELVAGCLNAGRISLSSSERTELRSLFAEMHLDSLLVEHLSLGQSFYPHRFHQGPAGNRADQGVAEAIRKVLDALPDVRAVWAVWRTTPAGSVAGPVPHRVVLAEIGSRGRPQSTAYRLEHALRRAGIRASVEVLRDGVQLPEYHRQAIEHSCRVPVDATSSVSAAPAAPAQPSQPPAPVAPPPPPQQQAPPAAQPPAAPPAQPSSPPQEPPRRPSWRERRAAATAAEPKPPAWAGDNMADLEQSEPVGPRSSGSYPVRAWQQESGGHQRPQQESGVHQRPPLESGVHQRPPEAVQQQPVDILGDDPSKLEETGVIDAIPAGPAMSSVDDDRPAATAPPAPNQEPPPMPSRPERPDFQRRRAFGQRDANSDPDSGIRAVPPVQPINSARSSANDPELNDQEKDLLRQLQEELAKRERTEESESSQWRADRSGRQQDGQASWAGGRSRQVNGVPPGSSGGGTGTFPPAGA
jgi:hypothetical protein